MPRAGQGVAAGGDARDAARRAARQAADELGGDATLALVYATEQYGAEAVMAGVRDALGAVPLAGARVPGVLARDRVTHDGVAVLLVAGADLAAGIGTGAGVAQDPQGAGAAAAKAALGALNGAGDCLREAGVLLVMPDAILGNSVEVVRGVARAVGSRIRVVGGGAGDDLHFAETFVLGPDGPLQDGVVALALKASGPIGVALRHGCRPWGPPMTVTAVAGRTVRELDWEPALDRYLDVAKEGGGDVASVRSNFVDFAMLHPLGIPQGGDDYVLRSPMMLGDDGAIHCCSDIPLHSVVRVMRGHEYSMLAAAREAGEAARAQLGRRRPAVALVLACVSRDVVLGANGPMSSREVAAVRDGLADPAIPIFGCLTFGQIGVLHGGPPLHHSKSVLVCALPAA